MKLWLPLCLGVMLPSICGCVSQETYERHVRAFRAHESSNNSAFRNANNDRRRLRQDLASKVRRLESEDRSLSSGIATLDTRVSGRIAGLKAATAQSLAALDDKLGTEARSRRTADTKLATTVEAESTRIEEARQILTRLLKAEQEISVSLVEAGGAQKEIWRRRRELIEKLLTLFEKR